MMAEARRHDLREGCPTRGGPVLRGDGPVLLPEGALDHLRGQPLEMLDHVAHTYGLFAEARLRASGRRLVFVNEPALVAEVLHSNNQAFHKQSADRQVLRSLFGDGLLTAEGTDWRLQRREAQPAFTSEAIALHEAAIVPLADAAVARWLDRGAIPDLLAELRSLTLEVLVTCVFGVRLTLDFDSLHRALDAVIQQPDPRYWFVDTPDADPAALVGAWEVLDEAATAIVDGHERGRTSAAGPAGRHDLLGQLSARLRATLSAAEARRRLQQSIWTMLVAGHETTALSVLWTLCLLQRDPTLQNRLAAGGREGAAEARNRGRGSVTISELLDESLRLRPPVYGIGRVSVREVELGGARFPEGAEFLVAPWVVHRHPAHFEDPTFFRPERWRGTPRSLPPYTFFPFGGGPRGCIGERLARLEAATMLDCLLARATVEIDGPEPVPRAQLTTRPDGEVPATLRHRRRA